MIDRSFPWMDVLDAALAYGGLKTAEVKQGELLIRQEKAPDQRMDPVPRQMRRPMPLRSRIPFWATLVLLWAPVLVAAQTVSSTLPPEAGEGDTFLFYLHGGVVQQQGGDAVSAYYGEYKYDDILDTLAKRGFRVISEVRPKQSTEEDYARKVQRQIDSLLAMGVPSDRIGLVGASLGAYVAMEVSMLARDPDIRFVLLGLCSDYALEYYAGARQALFGRFLSIYERSDSKGSCRSLFHPESDHFQFEELALQTGLDHGFLFQPYAAWVDPATDWIRP